MEDILKQSKKEIEELQAQLVNHRKQTDHWLTLLDNAEKGLAKYYKLYGFEMRGNKKAEAQLKMVRGLCKTAGFSEVSNRNSHINGVRVVPVKQILKAIEEDEL